MDPPLCQQINKCKWVRETKKLIIPKDKEAVVKELSKAAWYKDEFGGAAKTKQQEEEFADEEFMYDQDADKSVKTIHEVYKGAPNAPTFSVGRPNKIPAAGEDAGDDVSEISAMSKDDLVKLCKSLQIKAAKNPTKGPPRAHHPNPMFRRCLKSPHVTKRKTNLTTMLNRVPPQAVHLAREIAPILVPQRQVERRLPNLEAVKGLCRRLMVNNS
jgi:hypothetical protein